MGNLGNRKKTFGKPQENYGNNGELKKNTYKTVENHRKP